MDFIASILKALPVAATHPFAFVGYVLVIIVLAVLSWSTTRNKQLLSELQKIPPEDRLEAMRLEMVGIELKEGLTPEQWVVHRKRFYIFIGFLSFCMLAILIFTIAGVNTSKLKSSRKELIGIIKIREEQTINIIDEILKSQQLSKAYFLGADLVKINKKKEKEAEALRDIRFELIRINRERINALREDRLVLFHELGRALDELGKKIVILIKSSTGRSEEYNKLINMFATMDPINMQRATELHFNELYIVEKLQALNKLISESSKLEP